MHRRFNFKFVGLLVPLLAFSVTTAGCGSQTYNMTEASFDQTETYSANPTPESSLTQNTETTSFTDGGIEDYPHSDFVDSMAELEAEQEAKFDEIVKTTPLDSREAVRSGFHLVRETRSYKNWEKNFLRRRESQESQASDASKYAEETEYIRGLIKENIDFRPYSADLCRDFANYIVTPRLLEEQLAEFQMTQAEEEACRKSLEHYFARNEVSWQNMADRTADNFYEQTRPNFEVDALRTELREHKFSEEEIDGAIRYLEQTR